MYFKKWITCLFKQKKILWTRSHFIHLTNWIQVHECLCSKKLASLLRCQQERTLDVFLCMIYASFRTPSWWSWLAIPEAMQWLTDAVPEEWDFKKKSIHLTIIANKLLKMCDQFLVKSRSKRTSSGQEREIWCTMKLYASPQPYLTQIEE